MKPRPSLLFVLFCAVGLLAGYGARRLVYGPSGSQQPGYASGESSAAAGNRREAETKATTKLTFPPSHSTDTVETLAALDDTHLYARLALWLADATEPDIAAFWKNCYLKKENWTPEISNLLFLHWTRLDPRHALAVGADTTGDDRVWRAWACHDPQAALAAAIATDSDAVEYVAEGIGKFQPTWLLKHLAEIPENARDYAIESLNEDGGKNPLETISFLQQHGLDIKTGTLEASAREDPWAAVEWAIQKGARNDPFSSRGDALPTIIETLAAESPDELARIAERTPSGGAKLEMEAAVFANLVKTDPAAALEQAKSTTVSRTAAERYAAIGQSLVRADPTQALQLAKDLLAACPEALYLTARIQYPDGNTSNESLDIPGVDEFMGSLMTRQPQQVMEMIAALPAEVDMDQFRSFSRQWIKQDLVGYTNWLNQQANPAVRQSGAPLIAYQLRESGHYQEAAEWATSVDSDNTGQLDDVITEWRAKEPEAPARWLKDANLPPNKKAIIKYYLDRPR